MTSQDKLLSVMKTHTDRLLCTMLTKDDLPKNLYKFYNFVMPFEFSKAGKYIQPNDILLIKAIIFGDIEICKYFLNEHSNKEHALTWACNFGWLDIAQWLVSIGANIDFENHYPFHIACAASKIEIVKWLLSIEIKDIDYGIYLCCEYNGLEILILLLEHNNNNIGLYKKECFQIACDKNHQEIATLLRTIDPSLQPN